MDQSGSSTVQTASDERNSDKVSDRTGMKAKGEWIKVGHQQCRQRAMREILIK